MAFFIIFQITVFTVQGSIAAQTVSQLLRKMRMCQTQILICQFFQKRNSPHTVCQNMEYFQIDPVFIIIYPEQIVAFSALAHANVNVKMIDQGSSELNIIIGAALRTGNTASSCNTVAPI